MRAIYLLPILALIFVATAEAEQRPAIPASDPAFASGDFDAAERSYLATLAQRADDAAALAGLARLRLYQERRGEARKLAEQALTADPNNTLAKRIIAGVAAREAAFAPDVYRITMPRGGGTAKFVVTDPLPVVRVDVAGREVLFLVDTGAPDLVLDRDFASELGLQSQSAGQGTFAGGAQAAIARAMLPQAEIGGVKVSNIPVTLLPTRNLGGTPRIDGIVGTGFLMHFLATLDYRQGALILKPRAASAEFERDAAKHNAIIVPMWLVGDHFLFARGRINAGPEGLFNIDTGLEGGGVQATRAALDAAGVTIDESLAQTGQGGGGAVRFIPCIADATVGSLTVPKLNGIFTPDGDQYKLFAFTVAGTISHQYFRQHALTFDFEAMRMVIR